MNPSTLPGAYSAWICSEPPFAPPIAMSTLTPLTCAALTRSCTVESLLLMNVNVAPDGTANAMLRCVKRDQGTMFAQFENEPRQPGRYATTLPLNGRDASPNGGLPPNPPASFDPPLPAP